MSHTNLELASQTLEFLAEAQVVSLCVCPGARNSPWIEKLKADPRFENFYFFDERSAGFFALGKSRSTGNPVAVLTTSGTAVGELLPAVMEAYYTGAKLMILSADRPKRFRGTGAPQSCLQPGIFSIYARSAFDLDRDSKPLTKFESKENIFPLHLNVCFEEPLPTSESNRLNLGSFEPGGSNTEENFVRASVASKYPLLIVGELSKAEARELLPHLLTWKVPVVTEALSHLREEPALDSLRIRPHKKIWEEALQSGYKIDFVLRLGGIPTLRFWRDLEVHAEASKVPVFSTGDSPFSGMPRASHMQISLTTWLAKNVFRTNFNTDAFLNWKTSHDNHFKYLEEVITSHPLSEPTWFRNLSVHIPQGSQVYLGNSLPIREWDLTSCTHDKQFLFKANRGLNGIDGQFSTFLGGLSKDAENWAILGDLTTLYDSTGPWILSQLKNHYAWHLVIINNSGGRIFERMFSGTAYLNQHSISFEHWAKQWTLSFKKISDPRELRGLTEHIIEICPAEDQTREFWKSWEP